MTGRWEGQTRAPSARTRTGAAPGGRWSRAARASTAVGITLGLPHSINDVTEAIASLHTDMMMFGQELHDQVFLPDGVDQLRPGTSDDHFKLYHAVWRPLMNEWLEFRDLHGDSFWQNLPLSGAWDRVQEFRQRFIAVRDKAKQTGVRLMAPEPVAPRHEGVDVGDALKVAAYGAVGVGLLFALGALRRRTAP